MIPIETECCECKHDEEESEEATPIEPGKAVLHIRYTDEETSDFYLNEDTVDAMFSMLKTNEMNLKSDSIFVMLEEQNHPLGGFKFDREVREIKVFRADNED